MAGPVLISTDLDRTLIFSPRASAQLGGARPASLVEDTGRDSDAELAHAAAAALAALPAHALVCPATSRSLARLARLRLPFSTPYAVAANGGVVLADGMPDPCWAARIGRLLAGAAPAAEVRPVLAGSRTGAGHASTAASTFVGASPPWLVRAGEPDDMCCQVIVDEALLPAGELAAIADRCAGLGWQASLIGRKLYAFPAGFGKEHAVAYVAERLERWTGAVPARLAAGDTEHDHPMLAAAGRAWVPAGSELAASARADHVIITDEPGHAAAAQITRAWLECCADPQVFHDQGELPERGQEEST